MNDNINLCYTLDKIVDDTVFTKFEHKSILITGGTGFIMRYFISMIDRRNNKFDSHIKLYIIVRNLEKAKILYGTLYDCPDYVFIAQDICSPIVLEDNIDYIIHAAGQSDPAFIKSDPVGTFNANVLGTENVLSFAQKNQVKGVLYISSYMVFGGRLTNDNIDRPFIAECDYRDSSNCYTEGKRSGEMLCACYNKQYQVPIKIIRPSFVFGASERSDTRVWSEIIHCASDNKDIVLNSNGLCVRPVVYVLDLIKAILYVLSNGSNGTSYNVESAVTTIRAFAQKAANSGLTKSELVYKNPDDAIVSQTEEESTIDLTYQKKMDIYNTGWKPVWSLEDAIENAIAIERSSC